MVSPTFSGLVGQSLAVELLTQAVQQQRIAPAYLFAGPEGVGRRRGVRGFLELLIGATQPQQRQRLHQGNHPDVLWVEPTYLHQGKLFTPSEISAREGQKPKTRPQIRLEQVREISRFLSRSPLEASRSLVVLEQAESMGEAAANGLLKTLEEPGRASLILLAPSVEALLPTLVSRCQRIPFYRLTPAQMQAVLTQVGAAEILAHPQILRMAQGSPGAAIAHWQQLQTLPPNLLQTCLDLPRSLRQALELARQIDQSLDLEAQLWLVDYLQQIHWQQAGSIKMLQALEQARQQLLSYAQPRLVWEVTLLKLVKLVPLGSN